MAQDGYKGFCKFPANQQKLYIHTEPLTLVSRAVALTRGSGTPAKRMVILCDRMRIRQPSIDSGEESPAVCGHTPMRIDVHHHFEGDREPIWFSALLRHVTETGNKVMTTVVDAVNAAAAALNASLDNISGDIDSLQAEVATLKDQLGQLDNIPADAQAALDAVVARAQSLADRVA